MKDALALGLNRGDPVTPSTDPAGDQTRREEDEAHRGRPDQRSALIREQRRLELDRFKTDIDLVKFAKKFGYGVGDGQVERHGEYWTLRKSKGDKIDVRRSPDDRHWLWINFAGAQPSDTKTPAPAGPSLPPGQPQQGTIIDFLQRETGASLAEVCSRLRQELSEPPSPEVKAADIGVPPKSPSASTGFHRDRVHRDFLAARPITNSHYLASRGLRPETLTCLRFWGTFRLRTISGEVIFPHYDPDGITGFERKHPERTRFAKNGRRAVWHSRTFKCDRYLVIAESAIDAMSFHQLQPRRDARYMSTGGTLSRYQRALLERAIARMPPDSTLVLATDNDAAGRKMADTISELAQRANPRMRVEAPLPPHGHKDWNDVVKERERPFIRRVTRQSDHGLSR
jgi:hypothetical protein